MFVSCNLTLISFYSKKSLPFQPQIKINHAWNTFLEKYIIPPLPSPKEKEEIHLPHDQETSISPAVDLLMCKQTLFDLVWGQVLHFILFHSLNLTEEFNRLHVIFITVLI